jgi:xylulokinase
MFRAYNLPFDPYDSTPLPRRIFATGTAAHFPSIVNLLGDVFDAPVFVPSTVLEAAQLAPGVANSGNGVPSRAALGGAYLARWGAGLRRGTPTRSGFEEEIRWVLGKRWAEKQSAAAQHNGRFGGAAGAGGGTSPAVGVGTGSGLLGSGIGSIGKARSSGLAAHALVEEDEEELANANNSYGEEDGATAYKYATEDQQQNPISNTNSSLLVPPTMLTIPQPSASLATAATPTTAAPLTPIVALQTDDADAQFGLVKVAEPDTDAFLAYASMVPEFCRLEGVVVKGLA